MSTSVYTQATLNTFPFISIPFKNFQIFLLSLNYIVDELKTVFCTDQNYIWIMLLYLVGPM
jgi:hypothetical protein